MKKVVYLLTKEWSIGGNTMKQEKMIRYIQTRIEQLKEDMTKAHDEHDQKWYNRCIQELEWAVQMRDKPTHNCYMTEDDGVGFSMNKY